MNIILCDDDAAQVEQITRFLASRPSYRISTYHSGTELLSNLPAKCDIAILDIKLQDTLGTEIAVKLKAIYPMIDIILISAYPKYVTTAFHIEASQFLIKPIHEKNFLQEFDRILSERASKHFRWIITAKGIIYAFFPRKSYILRPTTDTCLSILKIKPLKSASGLRKLSKFWKVTDLCFAIRDSWSMPIISGASMWIPFSALMATVSLSVPEGRNSFCNNMHNLLSYNTFHSMSTCITYVMHVDFLFSVF